MCVKCMGARSVVAKCVGVRCVGARCMGARCVGARSVGASSGVACRERVRCFVDSGISSLRIPLWH